MQELGLDSLSFAELGVALEAAGVSVPENADITNLVSVPELQKAIAQWGRRKPQKDSPKAKRAKKKRPETESTADRVELPD